MDETISKDPVVNIARPDMQHFLLSSAHEMS